MAVKGRGLEFCCCAIPLINFGSYTICLEFIFVALCVALLAVGPPSIVATTGPLPSGWPKIVVCILGFIVVAWQVVGLISIKKEKTSLYRTYIRINFLLTLVTILVTLAFFAVSAARHSVALDNCVAQYANVPAGSSSTGASQLDGVGRTICDIFIWVQVGFMGLLIALIGLTQLYMCFCQRAYGKEMRRAEHDHKTFGGMNSEGIPLANRGSGIWEADGAPPPPPMKERGYGEPYNGRPRSDGSNASHEELQGAQYKDGTRGPHQHQGYASYDQGAGAPQPYAYQGSYDQPAYGEQASYEHHQPSYESQQYGSRQQTGQHY